MSAEIVWVGLAELQTRLLRAAETCMAPLGDALYQEGRAIMQRSVEVYCPIELGYLRSTAHVSPPRIEGTSVLVELSYGAEYALAVHEILTAYHRPPTQAKYLEAPFLERLPAIPNNLAVRMAQGWGF